MGILLRGDVMVSEGLTIKRLILSWQVWNTYQLYGYVCITVCIRFVCSYL